jgi:hypothetical protein
VSGIRRFHVALSAAAISATLLVAGVVAGSAGASAKSHDSTTTSTVATKPPHLVVTPVSGLTKGKIVRVSGKGFTANDQVYVVQCLASATGAGGCNIAGAVPVTVTANGTLPLTKFKVITGAIGGGRCGTRKSNLNACEISVGNASGGDSATVRIQFKLPKSK